MRYVDHDPVAARAAAAACRDAARSYVQVAGWLDLAPPSVPWWGGTREEVVADCHELARDLRAEAARLRGSADDLEQAAWRAERRDHELAAAAAVAAARSACQPTTEGHTVAGAVAS